MITAGFDRSSIADYAGPLLLMALVTLTQAGGPYVHNLMAYDRLLVADGELWRLLTNSFVHLSWYHWLLDVTGVIVLVVMCPEMPLKGAFAWRLVVLTLGMSAGLYAFAPSVGDCVGLSGVLHGMFLLGLAPAARRGSWVAVGCLVFLVTKLATESVMGGEFSDVAALEGHVVTESHLFGTLAALVYGLAARVTRMKPAR